jgi:S-DNA-T family DNA segregation ATPase FtsK/SpoIIIE
VTLLRDATGELERRAGLLARYGGRLWEPSPDAPALVVLIDEYAELPEEAKAYADSIARRGRAVAVTLLAATQRPTQAAMDTARSVPRWTCGSAYGCGNAETPT